MITQIMFINDMIWPEMKHGFFNDVIHFHFLLDFIHKKVHIKYVISLLLVILTPNMPLFLEIES